MDVRQAARGVLGAALYPKEAKGKQKESKTKKAQSQDTQQGPSKPKTQFSSLAPILEGNEASWVRLLPLAPEIYSGNEAKCEPHELQPRRKSDPFHYLPAEPHAVLREWVWDTMPNDVSKPLATTTLGFITILAMRMGMRWRSTDLSKGQLFADGNGYSISFIEISGLGLVARLSSSGNSADFPLLAPGPAVDKLMCGILPGSKDLVGQDIPCVSDERNPYAMAAICSRFSVVNDLIDTWRKVEPKRNSETQNDAISLLWEYLPCPGFATFKHYFWDWRGVRSTVLNFYEGRYAFRRRL